MFDKTKATGEVDLPQCGIQDGDGRKRECDEGNVCLLENFLNMCIRSMSAEINLVNDINNLASFIPNSIPMNSRT